MIIWVIAFIVSVVATLGMSGVFLVFSLIALNGFMSMSAAMPTYLLFNCFAWPIMVGITSFTSWLIFTLAKQKRPFWQLVLMNAVIVTLILGVLALVLSVS